MPTHLIKDSTGEYIDPASEDLQRDMLTELQRSSSRSTNDLMFQRVTCTTANTTYTPDTSHGCNSVRLWTASATVYVDDVNGDVSLQQCLLLQNQWLELPINQVSNLRFQGSAGGEIVYIVSSS